MPDDLDSRKAVYHTFVIQSDQRDDLKDYLSLCGIGTAIHYPIPIHLQDAGISLGYKHGSFPNSERQAKRILSLPIYPGLREGQLDYISKCIHDFYHGGAR